MPCTDIAMYRHCQLPVLDARRAMRLAANDVAAPVARLVREAVEVDAQASLEDGIRRWRRFDANAEHRGNHGLWRQRPQRLIAQRQEPSATSPSSSHKIAPLGSVVAKLLPSNNASTSLFVSSQRLALAAKRVCTSASRESKHL